MSFRITGLDAAQFEHLFGLSDDDLAKHRVTRYVTDDTGGYPCRVTLEDVGAGEKLLLVNYRHQPCATAYASQGPIFVSERNAKTAEWIDEIPDQFKARLISLRAYDANDMMIDADVVDGKELKPLVERFLANDATAYLHAHFARRGCFAGKIERN
jgi:hypothetical protein